MCDSESYLVTLVGFFYTTLTLKGVQQNQANKDLETETLFHYRRYFWFWYQYERSQKKPTLIQFTEEAKAACSRGKKFLFQVCF